MLPSTASLAALHSAMEVRGSEVFANVAPWLLNQFGEDLFRRSRDIGTI
jgi:hypothetical protein